MVVDDQVSFQTDWRRLGFFEGLSAIEATLLVPTILFWRFYIPKGDGTVVITVPGFCEADLVMQPLRTVLRAFGYNTTGSGVGINAQCFQTLCDQLVGTIKRTHEENPDKKLVLITHSLGELVAESACQVVPELVTARISLAAPKRLGGAHPAVIGISKLVKNFLVSCKTPRETRYSGSCTCQAVRSALHNPPVPIPRAAIWTLTDGVVDPECTRENAGQGINIQIPATHSGIIYNPIAYMEIFRLLRNLTLSDGVSFAWSDLTRRFILGTFDLKYGLKDNNIIYAAQTKVILASDRNIYFCLYNIFPGFLGKFPTIKRNAKRKGDGWKYSRYWNKRNSSFPC